MAAQYCCANENRRDAVRFTLGTDGNPVLNGIDYLEVASWDELTLEVHFIHNLPGETDGVPAAPDLSGHNFVIEGGVRIRDIKVKLLSVKDNVATLEASEAGDYSSYVLRLVAGAETTDPPSGFDPQLAAVSFSFKVECPSDFDCKPGDACPPEPLPVPLIDYLAKDYGSFRRLMLDRLAIVMPDWRERNPADLGVALVEAVAYVGDHLSYYQDAVATEAYLGTARQRLSLKRHARLLDYAMHDGCNARAWVYFEVEAGSAADGWTVPAGTPLLTRGLTPSSTVASADYGHILTQESPLVFETLHRLELHSAHNAIKFYTWDDTECCLPKGATGATLHNSPQLALKVGDALIFEEVISPATGLAADADPTHRHAVRLTSVVTEDSKNQPLVDQLHGTAIAEIAWDTADALPFPLCVSARIDLGAGPQLVQNLSLARGNLVLADHGQTLPAESLGQIGTDAAGRLVRPRLKTGPVTQQGFARDRLGEPVRDSENQPVVFNLQAPAVSAFDWQRRDTLPAIRLIENGDENRPWLPRPDLLASSRFDRHFTLEVDNEGRAHLRFGDGFHAAMPHPDSTFEAVYRVGNGTAGNIGAQALSRMVLDVEGIKTVRNPLPATGGTEPESMEQVRQYAPQAFRTQERAVTESDYAAVAERHAEVQKAAATLRWTGSWYTIFITIDRLGGRPVDESFKTELSAFIERFRLAGQDVEFEAPRFVPLDIAFTVCVKPGYYRSQVKADLLKLFSTKDLPDGRRGFFHPDNFTFGQAVYLSQMIALAMQVPGVRWVDAEDIPDRPNHFRRWGQPAQSEFEAGMITCDRLEIVRLDNDPSLPENGKIDFIMEGGL
jgi:Baseplate J-like protein